MRRIASGLAAAIAAVALLAPAASAQEASLTDIEDEVMCPICGTLLELSEAPPGRAPARPDPPPDRAGPRKEEIKEALVAEYGEEVLATPESSGFDLAAWVIPIAGLAAALAALGIWLRRRGGAGAEEAPPPPLDAADAERLERDISSRDI